MTERFHETEPFKFTSTDTRGGYVWTTTGLSASTRQDKILLCQSIAKTCLEHTAEEHDTEINFVSELTSDSKVNA